jgi:hypothetical protein
MTKERVTFVGKWFLNRKSLGLAANLYETNALSFVIPAYPDFLPRSARHGRACGFSLRKAA